jgi:hypothetical protein
MDFLSLGDSAAGFKGHPMSRRYRTVAVFTRKMFGGAAVTIIAIGWLALPVRVLVPFRSHWSLLKM